MQNSNRILLTTIFGPYGVKDGYAEDLGMQMELMNNQVTREQGIHSPRTNFLTFPLYFIAENISVPATVLDFPRWDDFTAELKKGYTHVGMSFIQMNVYKAKRMAEYIRENYPQIKIIVGGYATGLPDLKKIVPCDAVCPGEGIRWMREYFGEDTNRPIRHPVMHGVSKKYIYGIRDFVNDSAVIFPGLGCPNKCFFCATSSKFGGEYIPFLKTGREIFDLCERAERDLGCKSFAIIDENFLKKPERARELLMLMEQHKKTWIFSTFSSAEAILSCGIDLLVRLGVVFVWIGVESQKEIFSKLKDVDIRALIKEMQSKGISVLASSILFLEHHDRETIHHDIDWAIGLGADLHQFMQLTPLPGTPLYKEHLEKGTLIKGHPYTKLHGQDCLCFHHKHFKSEEAREITRKAFEKKYHTDGPAVLNMAKTILDGYRRASDDHRDHMQKGLRWDPETFRYEKSNYKPADPYMELRLARMRKRASEFRAILLSSRVYAPNSAARLKAVQIRKMYEDLFGRATAFDTLKSVVLLGFATAEMVRLCVGRLFGRREIIRQPPVRRLEYRQGQAGRKDGCACAGSQKSCAAARPRQDAALAR
ncbi:MAG TPA: radical SAM protein [bacterium]|nr:radical SAM protein [bacterium]